MSPAVNLRQHREALGLTQSAVASACGVSYQAVGQWERGTSRPGPDKVEQLEQVLQLAPGTLMDLYGYSKPADLAERLDDVEERLSRIELALRHVDALGEARDQIDRPRKRRATPRTRKADDDGA